MASRRKELCIGSYLLGYEFVRVEVNPNSRDGWFLSCCPTTHVPRISVGIAWDTFHQAMGCAYHEALELALFRLGCRYTRTNFQSFDTGEFSFFFDHSRFTEAVDQAAEFCEKIRPHLKRLWKKQRKISEVER